MCFVLYPFQETGTLRDADNTLWSEFYFYARCNNAIAITLYLPDYIIIVWNSILHNV